MSISGMSDILGTPDELDPLERVLSEDLIGEDDQDEDNSLLDEEALGDVSTGDKDLVVTTPTEDQGDSILNDTTDSMQVETDPVSDSQ